MGGDYMGKVFAYRPAADVIESVRQGVAQEAEQGDIDPKVEEIARKLVALVMDMQALGLIE